jgi:hypothetical protein
MMIRLVSEGKHEQSGALESLVKRLARKQIICDQDAVKRNDIHAFHGKGDGCFKKAVRWILDTQKKGSYDALILLIDEDCQKERRTQLDKAQDYQLSNFPRALGVAIRSFDAWMLADEKALAQVLNCPISCQSKPETIPDPKRQCKALRDGSQREISLSEMYSEVAGATNLDLLCERCPNGFAPFAERVRFIVCGDIM